jgi:hypothetical protein
MSERTMHNNSIDDEITSISTESSFSLDSAEEQAMRMCLTRHQTIVDNESMSTLFTQTVCRTRSSSSVSSSSTLSTSSTSSSVENSDNDENKLCRERLMQLTSPISKHQCEQHVEWLKEQKSLADERKNQLRSMDIQKTADDLVMYPFGYVVSRSIHHQNSEEDTITTSRQFLSEENHETSNSSGSSNDNIENSYYNITKLWYGESSSHNNHHHHQSSENIVITALIIVCGLLYGYYQNNSTSARIARSFDHTKIF